jgi:hypothetical protein
LAKQVWNQLHLRSEREALAGSLQATDALGFILKLKEKQRLILVISLGSYGAKEMQLGRKGTGGSAESLARAIRIYAKETTDFYVNEKKSNLPSKKRKEVE